LDAEHDDVFAFTRTYEDQKVLVVANFREKTVEWTVPGNLSLKKDGLLTSTYGGVMETNGVLSLKSFEAFASFVS